MWHHVDASDRVLGKLAERIAIVLMGKHKPIYDPGGTLLSLTWRARKPKPLSVDCGDYVVVSNARKIKVTGNKAEQLVYRHHTMFPGGLKEIKYKDMMAKKPDEVRGNVILSVFPEAHVVAQIIRQAVSGMLPKNKLRERRLERLRIFADDDIGAFQHNIVKRWEDGTLQTATVNPKQP